jgi:hypothetical protein
MGFSILVAYFTVIEHSLTIIFGVYLLIQKRAGLRYTAAYWRVAFACRQTGGYFSRF